MNVGHVLKTIQRNLISVLGTMEETQTLAPEEEVEVGGQQGPQLPAGT